VLFRSAREVFSVDVSPDGNYILTASEDRTLRLWSIASLLQKTPTHIRISTELDHPTCCKFSPTLPSKPTASDSKDANKAATRVTPAAPKGIYLVAVAMASSRSIHLYGIKDKKSKEGKSQWKVIRQFRVEHKSTITSLDFSTDGKYILSVSEQTEAKLWNLQGVPITTVNTNQFKNFMGCFCPNSLIFSIATFTGDTRIWEIETDKKGDFAKVNKTMQLSSDAHKTSVNCVAFSADSKRIVTASKDGTWKYWNIERSSQHYRGFTEDPQCLLTVKVDTSTVPLDLIALSPSGQMVAVVSNTSLYFYNIDGSLIRAISGAHKDTITSIVWLKDSRYLASSSLDKQVILWNPRCL